MKIYCISWYSSVPTLLLQRMVSINQGMHVFIELFTLLYIKNIGSIEIQLTTRLKTHRLFQVDIDRREQCCAANYEQVVNHVVPSCYS
jgi:hypothetical protein